MTGLLPEKIGQATAAAQPKQNIAPRYRAILLCTHKPNANINVPDTQMVIEWVALHRMCAA
jgi:hypothetical protein